METQVIVASIHKVFICYKQDALTCLSEGSTVMNEMLEFWL